MTRSRLCQTLIAAAFLAGFSAPIYSHTAIAADRATSNKGGDVRGTARADARAGTHGDQGRDRAQANQTKAKVRTSANKVKTSAR
jgi:hypothetical protein